jgi:hypothetical protein
VFNHSSLYEAINRALIDLTQDRSHPYQFIGLASEPILKERGTRTDSELRVIESAEGGSDRELVAVEMGQVCR